MSQQLLLTQGHKQHKTRNSDSTGYSMIFLYSRFLITWVQILCKANPCCMASDKILLKPPEPWTQNVETIHRPFNEHWSYPKGSLTISNNISKWFEMYTTNTCVFTSQTPKPMALWFSIFFEKSQKQETWHIWQNVHETLGSLYHSQKQTALVVTWMTMAGNGLTLTNEGRSSPSLAKLLACKECQRPRGHRVVRCHLALIIR